VGSYRALAEKGALGREIEAFSAPDAWCLTLGLQQPALLEVLVGGQLVAERRLGMLLLLDMPLAFGGPGTVLGPRFGTSGRLVIDNIPGIEAPWQSFTVALAR
jgi:hypothetical protein